MGPVSRTGRDVVSSGFQGQKASRMLPSFLEKGTGIALSSSDRSGGVERAVPSPKCAQPKPSNCQPHTSSPQWVVLVSLNAFAQEARAVLCSLGGQWVMHGCGSAPSPSCTPPVTSPRSRQWHCAHSTMCQGGCSYVPTWGLHPPRILGSPWCCWRAASSVSRQTAAWKNTWRCCGFFFFFSYMQLFLKQFSSYFR